MRTIAIAGNVGQDPEGIKYFESGQSVCNFSVAVRGGKDKQTGEDKTLWFRCAAWGKTAEIAAQYLSKGSKVAVSGDLDLTEFTAKDGTKKASLEIRVSTLTLLDSKKDSQDSQQPTTYQQPSVQNTPPPLPAEHAAYLQQFIALNNIPPAKALQITGGRGANQLYAHEYNDVLAKLQAAAQF